MLKQYTETPAEKILRIKRYIFNSTIDLEHPTLSKHIIKNKISTLKEILRNLENHSIVVNPVIEDKLSMNIRVKTIKTKCIRQKNIWSFLDDEDDEIHFIPRSATEEDKKDISQNCWIRSYPNNFSVMAENTLLLGVTFK